MPIVFGIAGALVSLFSLHLLLKSLTLLCSSKIANGEIVGNVVSLSALGSRSKPASVFSAEIEFEAKGRLIRFTNPWRRGWRYRIGSQVAVYYDPLEPEKAPRMKSLLGQWPGPLALLLLGAAFIFAAVHG